MLGATGAGRAIALALALLAPGGYARADDDRAERAAQVASIRRDLKGSRPATVAQAAYAAGAHDVREVVPDLMQALEHVTTPRSLEEWLVVGHLLDALIRMDARVPMADLARFGDRITTSEVILAMRNGRDAHPLFRKALRQDGRGQKIGALAVAAGNALVAAKDPEVAALYLSRIVPLVKVTVVDHDRVALGGGEMFGKVHRDGWCEVPEGFPPYVWYELGFRKSDAVESRLLVRGPTHDVWYERWENANRKFILGFLSDDGDATEVALGWTAALLGADVEDLGLKRRYYARHRWVDAPAFRVFVAEQRRAVQRDAASVLITLREAGLLSAADRDAVTIEPRFAVDDDRDDRKIPIPSTEGSVR